MQSHEAQQLWLAWGRGEINDEAAQAAAESMREKKRAEGRGGRLLAKPTPATHCKRMRPCDREKMFGDGRCKPLDGNAKARIWHYARALSHRIEKYKHYGPLTAKHVRVLGALLWKFHNADSGRCFPGYDKIKDEADCCRDTVYEAIHNLERLGILTWVHRIKRERECVPGLFGDKSARRWRVVRTSNAYTFNDPKPSKSEIPTRTTTQDLTRTSFLGAEPSGEAAKEVRRTRFANFGPSNFKFDTG
jgi:hypothetical protein